MAKFSDLEKFALVVLAFFALWFVKFLLCFVYKYFVGPALNKVDFRSKGQWALITGCTDGIGKAYAEALASRGCDVILISRSADKLKAVADKIEQDYKVKTHIVVADFTQTEGLYEKIARDIEGYEIGTLVNNVGVSYSHPEFFLDIDEGPKIFDDIIKANVVAVTRMCAMVMPAMVERGKGVVINIGSASSMIPSPLLTVYAASKAYVDKFTDDLKAEYSNKGLIIQCILPGFVVSNMSKLKRSSAFAPTAKNFVASALSLTGTLSRTTGYLPHGFMFAILNGIQSMCSHFAVWIVLRNMLNIRRRALKMNKNK